MDRPETLTKQEPRRATTTTAPLNLFVASGVTIAIGYVFLFVYAMVRRDHLDYSSAVIKSTGVSLAIGIAAISIAVRFFGVVRGWIEAGLGVLLLYLGINLAGRIGIPEGLKILFGGASALSFGLILTVIVVGLLEARRCKQGGLLSRYSLGGISVVAVILYLVQFLVLLADGSNGVVYLSQVLRSGDPILIVYAVIVYAGLLTILGCGIADCWTNRNIGKLYTAGLSAAWVVSCLIVGLTLMLFLMNLSMESIGEKILTFVLGIVGIIAPLAGAVYLCIGGIRDGMTSDQKNAEAGASRQPSTQVSPTIGSTADVTPALRPLESLLKYNIDCPTESPLARKLRELQNLHSQGLITEDEYQVKKREVLGQL